MVSLHTSQVAHQVSAYPGFCTMKLVHRNKPKEIPFKSKVSNAEIA